MIPQWHLFRSMLTWHCKTVIALTAVAGFAGKSLSAGDQKETAPRTVVAPETVVTAFAKADRNNDRQLSLEEFLTDRIPADAARRDFRLFDSNADDALSLHEFWAVPPSVNAEVRGSLPDPMQILIDQIMSALDKSLDNWDTKPEVEIDANGFVTALAQRFQKYGIQPAERDADSNGDGKVSRVEARRFLEIQFGIRRSDGKMLRLPSGRVVNYMLYLHVDLNNDDKLQRTEFIERSYGDPNTVVKEFDSVNANGDDNLSFDEWCQVPWRSVSDPVMEFRQMDTNFDAFVDPGELRAGSPEWKRGITDGVFPAFDLNKDKKLSLLEYQLTMQANMVLPWQTALSDKNGDETLTFDEFKVHPTLFPLLQMVYYHRLDQNSSGSLEPNEYTFTRRTPDEFFVMNADGTGWKSLFRFEGHTACGSPAVSPDGTKIAFDAWAKNQQGGSTLYVMSIDGGDPREIALGMMPNWSSDGKTLACSRSSPTYGAWLMAVEGNNHKHINPGWGAQFSPDGTRLAFTEGAVLKVYNVDDESTDTLLEGNDNPYRQIYWNSCWSPDGKRLCFKGVKADGTQEVASVNTNADKPELKIHHSGKVAVNADFAWHPTESRVVFSMFCAERKHTQMYEFDPQRNAPPTLVKGQDETRNNTDMTWTPDGKRLIIISGDY